MPPHRRRAVFLPEIKAFLSVCGDNKQRSNANFQVRQANAPNKGRTVPFCVLVNFQSCPDKMKEDHKGPNSEKATDDNLRN